MRGNVEPLVRTATSGRPVVAVDGCPLACCDRVLEAKGVRLVRIVRLHEYGLLTRRHLGLGEEERRERFEQVLGELAPVLLEHDEGCGVSWRHSVS